MISDKRLTDLLRINRNSKKAKEGIKHVQRLIQGVNEPDDAGDHDTDFHDEQAESDLDQDIESEELM